MKKVNVKIIAEVNTTISVPDMTTDEDIKNGCVDIYFHTNKADFLDKEDLGADKFSIEIQN